jgi:trimethylamine--corrinoid protein Co-methyltransferase
VFGAGTGVMNMRTVVDVYNAPGVVAANQAHLDLVHGVYALTSWSYAGHSDGKLTDEQRSLELGIATILGALSRAILLHDVGYLESGLQSALEGLALGDEVVGHARALTADVPVDDEALALAEIEAASPGGNHLGSSMTRARHRRFWSTDLPDESTRERWLAHDRGTLLERVRRRVRELLDAGPACALDPAVVSVIDDLADRPRKERR